MNGIYDEGRRKIEPWSRAKDDRWCSRFNLWICYNDDQKGSTTIKSKLPATKVMSDFSLIALRSRGEGVVVSTFGRLASAVVAAVEMTRVVAVAMDWLNKGALWLVGEGGKEEKEEEEWKREKMGSLGNLNKFLALEIFLKPWQ